MKSLYILACCLLLAAIVADAGGKCYYMRTAGVWARAAGRGETQRELAKSQSTAALSFGNRLTSLGMATALLGMFAWLRAMILARRQCNRLGVVVPSALLIAYVLLSLMMV